MLRLIYNEKSELECRWLPDSELSKYPNIKVIGPVPMDKQGFPESSDWLVFDGKTISVDENKKAKIKAQEADRDKKDAEDKKVFSDRFEALKKQESFSQDELVELLKMFIKKSGA